jgi:photosystem II stability/assembly factor-like uncharacterized protein
MNCPIPRRFCPYFLHLIGVFCFAVTSPALTWVTTFDNPTALRPIAFEGATDAYWSAGDGFIASSTDGSVWDLALRAPQEQFSAIKTWDGSVIAGTRRGAIFYRPSEEGDWSQFSLQAGVIEFERENNLTLALTSNNLAVSSDFEEWEELAGLPPGVSIRLKPEYSIYGYPPLIPQQHLAYGDGVFVLAGDGNRSLWKSTDGRSWEEVAFALPEKARFEGRVAYHNGFWLAVARSNDLPLLLRSTDLETWSEIRLPDGVDQIFGIRGESDEMLAWGTTENGIVLYRSSDGLNWNSAMLQANRAGLPSIYPGVVDGPAGLLAMDLRFRERDELGYRLLSDDGVNWTELNPYLDREEEPVIKTASVEGRFFASAPWSGIRTSPDGETWSIVASSSEAFDPLTELDSAAYHAASETWFVLAKGGALLSSTDGSTWAPIEYTVGSASTEITLSDLAVLGDELYAVARSPESAEGAVVASSDGAAWTEVGPTDIPPVSTLLATEDAILIHTPVMRLPVIFDETGRNASVVGSQKPDWYSENGTDWEELETGLDGEKLDNLVKTQVLGTDFVGITRKGRVYLWSKSAGLREVRPRDDNDFFRVNSISQTAEGLYALLSTNGEFAIGNDLQWMERQNFPEGVKTIVAGNDVIVGVALDAIFTTSPSAESYYWDTVGQRYESWVQTKWYGWIYDGAFPWIYHPDQGWVYQVLSENGTMWMWDQALERWTWTSSETYPYLFLEGSEDQAARWVYYLPETRMPLRWFYDTYLKDWVPEPDFDLSKPPSPPPGG